MQYLQQNRSRLLGVMAQHPELVSVLLISVFMFFAKRISYSNAGHDSAEPIAIFAEHSPVKEYKNGNMQEVQKFIQNSTAEVYFIMYYAPWDGSSLEAVEEYETAAYDLYGEVTFLAVNCWWPKGSCRKNVPLRFYPMLMAYNDKFEGVQYRGIMKAKYIIEFLKRICSPVIYVPDGEELAKFVAQAESSLIGHFDFTGSVQVSGYDVYYQAALYSLEKDPTHPLQFGVITSRTLASSYGILVPKTVILTRVTNRTLIYPASANFTSKAITEWAYENRQQLILWLAPAQTKSITLSKQVLEKPFVLLLTSHERSDNFTSNFQQLREVALEYYSCNNSSKIRTSVDILRAIRLQHLEIDQLKLRTQLSSPWSPSSSSSSLPSSSMSSFHWKADTRNQSCCNSFLNRSSGNCMSNMKYSICDVCLESITTLSLPQHSCPLNILDFILCSGASTKDFVFSLNSCVNFYNNYNPGVHFSVCCKHGDVQTYDCFSETNNKQQTCNENAIIGSFREPATYSLDHIPSYRVMPPMNNTTESVTFEQLKSSFQFTGLACQTNRTVNFFAMNTDVYGVYADRLGIHYGNKKPALAIIDVKNEIEYILDMTVNTASIKNFIIDYTVSQLPQQLRTATTAVPSISCNHGDICVTEVVTENFSDIVLVDQKDVLLLYYASWCGYCLRFHQIYLSVAQVFHSSHHLTIARINGDINDLPVEFTVTMYPTILFYPAGHKSWTAKFPQNEEMTVENLSLFILENAVKPVDF